MIKSILVHAEGGAGGARQIDAALDIARKHDAHLTAMLNLPTHRYLSTDPFGGTYLMAEALAQARAELENQQALLAARLERDDVPWDVLATEGDLVAALAAAGALSDLIIVERHCAGPGKVDPYPNLAGDLALAVRLPVLALPADGPLLNSNSPAIIAWNGSTEAAAALRMAVPLLHDRPVTLLHIDEADGLFADNQALSYLSRHGIHAVAQSERRGVETLEETILRIAQSLGAGLLVMGAFGHSRLRQTLFGGVTKFMLREARVPLLLGH